jgi:ADP-heptose:LPS heptosyltransferase
LAKSTGFTYFGIAHKSPDHLLGRFTVDNKTHPWRVLVVQAWGMGDAIMTVSLLRLIREKLGGAYVEVIVGGGATGELLRSSGLADEITILPQRTGVLEKVRLFADLQQKQFDCALVGTGLHYGYAFLARWLAQIPRVVSDRFSPLPSAVIRVRNDSKLHRFVANGMLLKAIVPDLTQDEVMHVDPNLGEAVPSRTASELAGHYGAPDVPWYAIHLGSGGQNVKRIPPELAYAIVDRLAQRKPSPVLFYIEGPSDPPFTDLPERIQRQLIRVADWSVGDLRYLLSQCDAVLTGDTGISHLTAASGGKAVVLAGPTNVEATRPWGDVHAVVTTRDPPPCMPCYGTSRFESCPYGVKCMTSIDVEDVLDAMHPRVSRAVAQPSQLTAGRSE